MSGMRVTVVGLGYVGLTAAAVIANLGHKVLGVEKDETRLSKLMAGDTGMYEPGLDELLHKGLKNGQLQLTHTSDEAREGRDTVVIAVGTPSMPDGSADISQVLEAVRWVVDHTEGPTVILMKSSVPPGTGVRIVSQELEGTQCHYVANPEFLRQGSAVQDWLNPARIVIGAQDLAATQTIKELYSQIEAPIVRTDITTAELIKYASNALLVTKISFINEIAMICERVGSQIDDVVHGLSLDPRIGPSSLGAGIGWGGSCFPKDARALESLASANGNKFDLLTAVISVNDRQRLLPVQALREVFEDLGGMPLTVLGLTFKPGTDDLRDAPALSIIRALHEEGAKVRAYDPVGVEAARALLPEDVEFMDTPIHALCGAKAAILATEWPEIVKLPWDQAASVMAPPRFVFDGRNALDMKQLTDLGFHYRGVGRSRSAESSSH